MKQEKHTNLEAPWVEPLLDWFKVKKRCMPWRQESTPYRRWLSEIMLQQTRVETGIPYFHRFVERYPDIPSLAATQEDEVLKLWEGLGYYSRARNLLKAARVMVEQHGGNFPDTEKEAQALPGVGPYTAAAVLSMAYGVPLPSVDGNVLRVYARLAVMGDNVMEAATVKKVQQALGLIIPRERPGDFNEAMMELGALVCLPANPACDQCPVKPHCQAYANGQVDQLPLRIVKDRTTRHHYGVYYLLDSSGTKAAVKKNPPKGLLGGLWAFPMVERVVAGKKQKESLTSMTGSQLEEQARLDTLKQWQVTLRQVKYKGRKTHVFSHRHWTMDIFQGVTKDQALPEGCEWVGVDSLQDLAFPEVYQKVIRLMEERPD